MDLGTFSSAEISEMVNRRSSGIAAMSELGGGPRKRGRKGLVYTFERRSRALPLAREAQIAAQLDHCNVVAALDAGVTRSGRGILDISSPEARRSRARQRGVRPRHRRAA